MKIVEGLARAPGQTARASRAPSAPPGPRRIADRCGARRPRPRRRPRPEHAGGGRQAPRATRGTRSGAVRVVGLSARDHGGRRPAPSVQSSSAETASPRTQRARVPSAIASGDAEQPASRGSGPGRSWRGVGSAMEPRGARKRQPTAARSASIDANRAHSGRSLWRADPREDRHATALSRNRNERRGGRAETWRTRGPWRAARAALPGPSGQKREESQRAAGGPGREVRRGADPRDEPGGERERPTACRRRARHDEQSVARSTIGARTIMFQAQRDRISVPSQTRQDQAAASMPPPGRQDARPRSAAVTSEAAPASAEGKRTRTTVDSE